MWIHLLNVWEYPVVVQAAALLCIQQLTSIVGITSRVPITPVTFSTNLTIFLIWCVRDL